MQNRSVYRLAWMAAVVLGLLPLFGAAAGAQTCYPPTPACATTTSGVVSPTSLVRAPDDDDDDDDESVVRRTATTGSPGGNLARTGAIVIPTVLVGLGLVAGGIALKRSSKRRSAHTSV